MTMIRTLARAGVPSSGLADPGEAALFLDLDGTLIDIAPSADRVVVPNGLPELLESLRDALDGALAIVTGRPIADVDRLFGSARFVAAGIHGAEYRSDPSEIVRHAALPLDPSLVARLGGLAARFPGVRLESKGPTVALHWRDAPECEAALGEALEAVLTGAPDHLELRRGRRVFEIVPLHVSKGAALEILCGLERFAGRRPIMIGDDLTDESAIAAAERLGGVGFRVAGETFPSDAADFASPRQVREWLSVVLARVR